MTTIIIKIQIEVTVDGEEECSSTPAIEWLRERRLFLMLYNKPLFAKFRYCIGFQLVSFFKIVLR